MSGYAWKGRSSGWVADVQDSQWKLFRERTVKTRNVLMDAHKLKEKCPCWYGMMLTLALAENWDLVEVDRVFNESIRNEPKYLAVYMNKSVILQPRWSGEPGDWQKFAKESANKLGGPAGDKLYARMIWDQQWLVGPEYCDDFRSGKLSWETAKRGFRGLMSDYLDDLGPPSEYCAMSVAAGDREQAKELFQLLGNRVMLGIWTNVDKFKHARDWAMGLEKIAPN